MCVADKSAMSNSFLHLVFIGVVALFPVVNPIGSALIVSPYFSGLTASEKRAAVRKIALYAFGLCVFFLFAGHLLLSLFGISVPVIQVAGGIMICKTGWESLADDGNSSSTTTPAATNTAQAGAGPGATPSGDGSPTTTPSPGLASLEDKLFYPITFPITTGAGTISVLITLGAHGASTHLESYLLNTSATLVAVVIMCALIVIFYNNTKAMLSYLGSQMESIINRLMAFLLFCVGLQIATTGALALFKH